MFTPLLGGDDRERAERDIDRRVDEDRTEERDGDLVDRVVALDQERGSDREDDLPDELLADPDPLAGLGVEVVVEGAEQADPGERRQRREDAGLGTPPGAGDRTTTTAMISAPPIVGVPSLTKWASGPRRGSAW